MKLSIVIVNYNVRHYLEQCLQSVYASAGQLELEVWVVDNHSIDDSLQMLRDRFPQVEVIANEDNVGFARANNQALRRCTGDYVLLLNPDTIVQEDTFECCISFIERTAGCGGVSVKMINGEGEYLKESKRGFPSPRTSFYKISGLIRLLPHHPKVAAYYMGHLSDDETHRVEVLPGAFIMMRREVLADVGLLDESYFMYGEDIDFSWRIVLAGYDNYYLPATRILHYKGESTKHGSMNYVYAFYNAMMIFVKRYFSGSGGLVYQWLIRIAIRARALLALLRRVGQRILLPVVDMGVSYASFYIAKQLWATYWADNVHYYPSVYTWGILPLYALLITVCVWLSGGYDKPVRRQRIARGVVVGGLALLVFYSLLDETLRYSRAILVIGTLWTLATSLLTRRLLGWFGIDGYATGNGKGRRMVVVGEEEECGRIRHLFERMGIVTKDVRQASPREIGGQRFADLCRTTDVVVFSTADTPVKAMLDAMERNRRKGLLFRTAPSYGELFVGGSYIYTIDNVYNREPEGLYTTRCRRNKRLFDLMASLLALLLSPILVFFQEHRRAFLRDILQVIGGRKTWVGYSQTGHTGDTAPLPPLKQGVLHTSDRMPKVLHPDTARLDHDYAQGYTPMMDAVVLWKNWRRL
ncbi:MAG: glycosyltransferase [Bacteroidales bacterium]|nr:glycosyltransferase [Bacteroidales bacterium]